MVLLPCTHNGKLYRHKNEITSSDLQFNDDSVTIKRNHYDCTFETVHMHACSIKCECVYIILLLLTLYLINELWYVSLNFLQVTAVLNEDCVAHSIIHTLLQSKQLLRACTTIV